MKAQVWEDTWGRVLNFSDDLEDAETIGGTVVEMSADLYEEMSETFAAFSEAQHNLRELLRGARVEDTVPSPAS